jgi:hypothetical protein
VPAHERGLDLEDVPPGLGPGQARDHAEFVPHGQGVIGRPRRAQVLRQTRRRDDGPGGLALGDLARDLAAQRRDLAVEVAQPGLACVLGDDALEGRARQAEHRLRQAMVVHVARQDVPHRDGQLLLFGVTRQEDQLHAVAQRPGDRVHHVRRGDEEHLRQVEGHVQVEVHEAAVLLRIEDLEQGRGRVARKSAPSLSSSSSMNTGLRLPADFRPWMMRPGMAPT